MKKVDLHIHSVFSSDGEVPPEEIIRKMKSLGFSALSITDHDTMKAYPEAYNYGSRLGIEIIKGVEFTTGFRGRETHLLAYFLDENEAVSLIKEIETTRMELTRRRLEKLEALGMPVPMNEVLKRSKGTPPTGPIIAELVIENHSLGSYKKAKDPIRAFYNDYFLPGKPAFVERVYMPTEKAISRVRKLISLPVLAHPGAFVPFSEEEIRYLREAGLEGIEAESSYHSREQIKFYSELASKYSLVKTCGSDFHGKRKPWIKLGDYFCPYSVVEEMRRRKDAL